MADDEIAVTIEGEPVTAEPSEGETAEPVADFKAQIAELTAARQRDTERANAAERAAALARNQAREAAAEAANVRKEAADRTGESIDTGISAATAAIEAAKKEIKAAGEVGDHGAQAEAYDRLATARAELSQLTRQKADVEIKRTEAARPRSEQRRETEHQTQDDPFESMLADMAQNGARKSADWIRKNKSAWADEKQNARIRAAHFDAVADGIAPESEEYFEFVERKIGLRETEPAAKPAAPKPATRRPPVAPVSESGGGMNGNGSSGTTVRLTKGQAAAATDGTLTWNYPDPTGKNRWKVGDVIGITEMARRVHEQTKQGLYDANNINA